MYEGFDRIVIVGGPRCGKTSLSARLDRPTYHTDDLILDDLASSGVAVASWFNMAGPWVVEGVTTAGALRWWLDNFAQAPCDLVLTLWQPLDRLTFEQSDMLETIRRQHWSGLKNQLARRDVAIRDVRFK